MPRYKITATVEDTRIQAVQKKMAELFGTEGHVEKINDKPSRADRFADAQASASDARNELESLSSELEDWLGNMPENLQNGDKAQQIQSAIYELQAIMDNLDPDSWTVDFPGMF